MKKKYNSPTIEIIGADLDDEILTASNFNLPEEKTNDVELGSRGSRFSTWEETAGE